ncbi:hypothetical protein GF337_05570 [candidate division KSB1 bacterium]|nr:hypothetical protein [candidate division KSB1 bacterium]
MTRSEKSRKSNPTSESIILTSFMAGLNEFRILNQSLVNLAGKRSGYSLAQHIEKSDTIDLSCSNDPVIQFKKIIDMITSTLSVSLGVDHQDDELIISIDRETCNICPGKFTKAESKSTLCLFPSIIEEFVNYFWKYSITLSREYNFPYLKQNDNKCIVRYKIMTKR